MRNKKLKHLNSDSENMAFAEYLLGSYQTSANTYLDCFIKCRENFDEESIHDLRVSIRRITIILDILIKFTDSEYAKVAKRFIRNQFKTMSALRDVQVMMIKTKKLSRQFDFIYEFANYLRKKEKNFTRKVKNILTEKDYSDAQGVFYFLQSELNEKIHSSSIDFPTLADETDILFEKLEDCSNNINAEETATIHKTRIAFKKFRYLYEFQIGVNPNCRHTSKELGQFQTKMGVIQDVEVMISELIDFIDRQSSLTDMMPVLVYLIEERRKLIDSFLNFQSEYKLFWNF